MGKRFWKQRVRQFLREGNAKVVGGVKCSRPGQKGHSFFFFTCGRRARWLNAKTSTPFVESIRSALLNYFTFRATTRFNPGLGKTAIY